MTLTARPCIVPVRHLSVPKRLGFPASRFSSIQRCGGPRLPSPRRIPIQRNTRSGNVVNSVPSCFQRETSSVPEVLKHRLLGLPSAPSMRIPQGAFIESTRINVTKLWCALSLPVRQFHSSPSSRYDRLQNLEDAANRDRDNANAQAVFLQVVCSI